MKFSGFSIFCFICLGSLSAFGAFTGYYDLSNWTHSAFYGSVHVSLPPPPVDISNPSSLSIASIDIGSDLPSNHDFYITVSGEGIVNFEWEYLSYDFDGYFNSAYDPFGILLNGGFIPLTEDIKDEPNPITLGGSVSIPVTTGDVFGFRAHAVDSNFGSAVTTISNFNFLPGIFLVPEPATIVLLGTGFAGIAVWRRRNSC